MAGVGDYFMSPFVLRAFLAVVLIAVNAGVSGSFAMFRNSTFLVSGASHAALAGAAAVILLHTSGRLAGVDPMIGGGAAAVLLSVLAANAGYWGKPGEVDTQIGVGFAFSMAVALLLVSLIPESAARVWSIMVGDILLITWSDLVLLASETFVVVVFFLLFRREFLFIAFDMEGAKAMGINARSLNLLMYALIGLSVAAMLKGIGAILVFAMMTAPAAAAMLVGRSVGAVVGLAVTIALVSGVLSIVLGAFVNVSVSAVTALLASAGYFALLVQNRTGRRRE